MQFDFCAGEIVPLGDTEQGTKIRKSRIEELKVHILPTVHNNVTEQILQLEFLEWLESVYFYQMSFVWGRL